MYKITITQLRESEVQEKSEYVKKERPYTQEEVDKLTGLDKERYEKATSIPMMSDWGYKTPPKITTVVEVTVLSSQVQEMDLKEVIKAVHGIK